MLMRSILVALAIALVHVGARADAPAQVQPIAANHSVFVVRHLQKGDGVDPALTPEGAANAERLAAMLKGKGIVAVFATPTRRAMETGEPLANALGIAVTPYDPAIPASLAAKVAAAGGPVLVVGHSNTVPDLVQLFGGPRPAPLSEQDFGTVYDVEPGGQLITSEVR
jgi:broad specificity phosphatase PhoE